MLYNKYVPVSVDSLFEIIERLVYNRLTELKQNLQ